MLHVTRPVVYIRERVNKFVIDWLSEESRMKSAVPETYQYRAEFSEVNVYLFEMYSFRPRPVVVRFHEMEQIVKGFTFVPKPTRVQAHFFMISTRSKCGIYGYIAIYT